MKLLEIHIFILYFPLFFEIWCIVKTFSGQNKTPHKFIICAKRTLTEIKKFETRRTYVVTELRSKNKK